LSHNITIYRPEIAGGLSQGQFVAIINQMGRSFKDSHTHFFHGEVGKTLPNPKILIIYTGGWGVSTGKEDGAVEVVCAKGISSPP
jgi:hypothetical protein